MVEAIPVVKVAGGLGESPAGEGLQLPGPLNEASPVTLASASTVDLGAADANTINISGSVTISSWGSARAGIRRTTVFGAAPTITHHATSMILPGGASIVAAAGDVAEWLSLGSGNWRCIDYTKANGQALAGSTPTPYVSTKQTITSGGSLTLSHGLTNTPSKVWAELHCEVIDGVYAVGDIIQNDYLTVVATTNADRGIVITKTATQLRVRFGSHANAFMALNGSGVSVALTNTSWRLVIKAEL